MIWCCTPSDQVKILGSTMSGMKLLVAARASAWVTGGTLTWSNPPPARNPVPVAHQAGAPESAQVIDGFCSVCSWGGRELVGKLLGITS